MVQLLGVHLTAEQQAILDTCPTPDYRTESGKGQLTRITAAAGTGKTTTLLALALQGARQGHVHITYLTFTKASARDGQQRLREALSQAGLSLNVVSADACTLHSCARRALGQTIGHNLLDSGIQERDVEDKNVKAWIARESQGQIDEFLQDCFLEIDCRRSDLSKKEEAKERAREQVEFFLFKTLQRFCQQETSREHFETLIRNRDYYPAKLFHDETQLGFEKAIYSRKIGFYADQACRLWDLVVKDNIHSHDFQMKRAQLLGLRIPGTLLLVDESQDMDGCQVSWSAKQQVVFGTHIYVVGDAAQTLFTFRGAKSQSLMALEVDKDCMLTASWRFGEAIARTANCILFSKTYSPQTQLDWDGRFKNWRPYRIRVGVPREDRVTQRSLLPRWRELDQLTLIARANITLMFEIFELLSPPTDADAGPKPEPTIDVKHDPDRNKFFVKHESWSAVDAKNADDDRGVMGVGESNDFPREFPKIHINGGESSGIHTWKKIMGQVGAIYDLYRAGGAGMSLPRNLFHEFRGRKLHWDSFDEECTRRDLFCYLSTYVFVDKYKARTLQVMESFRTHVIERRFEAAEADIILTTCHAAKGMEWENVQLCEDFIDLNTYKRNNTLSEKPMQFGFVNWGDDVNILYVACTRAKRQLSIPSSSILRVLKNFDSLHQWYLRRQVNTAVSLDDLELEGVGRIGDEESVLALYKDLVTPLRTEYSLKPHQLLVDTLIDQDGEQGDGESDGNPYFDAGLVIPDEIGIQREPTTDHANIKQEPDTDHKKIKRELDADHTNVKREPDADHTNIKRELVTPLRTVYIPKPHQPLVDTLIDLHGEPGGGESDGNSYFDVGLVIPDEIGIQREPTTDHANIKQEPDTDHKKIKRELDADHTNFKREPDTDHTNIKRELDTDHTNIKRELDTDHKKIKREPGT
jgi:superfamily I DNA/RNA helicase